MCRNPAHRGNSRGTRGTQRPTGGARGDCCPHTPTPSECTPALSRTGGWGVGEHCTLPVVGRGAEGSKGARHHQPPQADSPPFPTSFSTRFCPLPHPSRTPSCPLVVCTSVVCHGYRRSLTAAPSPHPRCPALPCTSPPPALLAALTPWISPCRSLPEKCHPQALRIIRPMCPLNSLGNALP